MNILIKADSKVGGGIAVTDSICSLLYKFPKHKFYVILGAKTNYIKSKIDKFLNVEVFEYDLKMNYRTVVMQRDIFYDNLVETKKIDIVFTVFGPSYWTPRCSHLLGFARPHIVWADSPYFKKLNLYHRIREKIFYKVLLWCFKNNSKYFYTENPQVSARLQKLIKKSTVYTVTSYYHQVYDKPNLWKKKPLPPFDGTTMLTIAAPYPHKNLSITIDVAIILKKKYPNFKFRFVMTLRQEELNKYDMSLKDNFVFIDRVKIEECPSLYQQSDIMWMPSLLECFSGTYAEAMRMKTPIVTTNMEFAHGICSGAAKYFSPLSAAEAADCIYTIATNKIIHDQLVTNGLMQLKLFNNSEERASILINILEEIVSQNKRFENNG